MEKIESDFNIKEVYVLMIHFNENDMPHTEFQGVYLDITDAENCGNKITFKNKSNKGKISYDDPDWVETNEIAFSIIKTKLL